VAVADALLDALEAAGIATTPIEARRTGFASATWPGRLELLQIAGRDILLDGAHNPAGAAALAIALDDLRPFLSDGPLTLITASMADKDVDGVIAALAQSRSLSRATVVCTSLGLSRALSAEALATRWRAQQPGLAVVAEPEPRVALDRVLDGAVGGNGPLVVAGSLYLVGAARAHLVDDPDLRDPARTEDA
jgi:dihydrofolate synthase/folylpolyglutamate synthase